MHYFQKILVIIETTIFVVLALVWHDIWANWSGFPKTAFQKTLIAQSYTFEVSTNASGAVRELTIRVSQNNKLLITIRQKTDGWVIGAETADLDKNGSPEIYVYARSYGSGAFGKIYGYQFFPTSFDAIHTPSLSSALAEGYMGHDSYKTDDAHLIRQFPIYRPGDVNAKATGGTRIINYKLVDINKKLMLIPL